MNDVAEIQLTREQLYDLIWSKPMAQLAKEFEISDTGLAKLCSRINIPRPGRGYWGRSRHPEERRRKPLPRSRAGSPEVVVLRRRGEEPAKQPTPQAPVVQHSKSLAAAHPFVQRTATALYRAREGQASLLVPRGKGALEVVVTRSLQERALLLLDSLIKALEKRGHEVRAAEDFTPRTFVTVDGETLRVSLKEQLERSEHQLTAEEEAREARTGWSSSPRFDYSPMGKLRVRIEDFWGWGNRRTWSDGKRKRLDSKLGEVVVGLELAAELQRNRRLEHEAERRRWHDEWERREAEQKRREEEARRQSELLEQAQQWETSTRVLRFVEAVERESAGARTVKLQRWIDWAKELAREANPVRHLTMSEGD